MKFAMYGSGAAGSVFASYLRNGGADIILIDRYEAHMKKVAEEGMQFTIHQEENGSYHDIEKVLTGFRTYTSAAAAAEAEGKVDVIIYMTKATQLAQAIQDSMPVVGDKTVAVSLINGLGNDDNLFKVFPNERCIIGSGVLGTALPEPAHCVSTPAGGVQMNFGGAAAGVRRAHPAAEAAPAGGGRPAAPPRLERGAARDPRPAHGRGADRGAGKPDSGSVRRGREDRLRPHFI